MINSTKFRFLNNSLTVIRNSDLCQSHTNVVPKISFSYVLPKVVVMFEYLIYGGDLTVCNIGHNVCYGHSTACFSMGRTGSESLPVNRRFVQLTKIGYRILCPCNPGSHPVWSLFWPRGMWVINYYRNNYLPDNKHSFKREPGNGFWLMKRFSRHNFNELFQNHRWKLIQSYIFNTGSVII